VPAAAPTVHALLAPGAPELRGAVAAQERPPEDVREAGDLAAAARAAAAQGAAQWLWLLDGSALPAPGALSALLAALDASPPLPAPALLASKVVDAAGAVVPEQVPWYRRGRTQVAMLAVAHRMLPVRAARLASVLVRADALAAAPSPRGPVPAAAAGLALTAGLLRGGDGFLVPASVAVARPAGPARRDPLADPRAGLALLRAPAWERVERLWLGPDVAGRALRALRGLRRRAA